MRMTLMEVLVTVILLFTLNRLVEHVSRKAGHHPEWLEMDAADRIFTWITVVWLTWVVVSISWDLVAQRDIRLLSWPQPSGQSTAFSFLLSPSRSDQTDDGTRH
jgi:hypothetical protein